MIHTIRQRFQASRDVYEYNLHLILFISFIAGMLGMGFWKFLLATLAGIIPLAVALAVFGENWQSMKTGLLWLSAASLIGLGAKIWLNQKTPRQD